MNPKNIYSHLKYIISISNQWGFLHPFQLKQNILILILIFTFCYNVILAQEEIQNNKNNSSKYGIYGHMNLNWHSADFRKLPGVPNCCPRFENGLGIGFTAGILYEIPLSKLLTLDLRASYSSLDGELSKVEPTTVIVQGNNQEGEFEHILNTKLANIGVEPLVGIRLFGGLRLLAGLRLGFTITNKYDQVETIVKPSGAATFLDSLGNDTHSRTRNESSGDILEIQKFQAFALAGLSYELPLNSEKSLFLAPELFYSHALTPVVRDYKWNVNSIRAGIAIKYSPVPVPKPKIIEERKIEKFIDTIQIVSDDVKERKIITGIPEISFDSVLIEYISTITESYIRTDTLYIPKKYSLSADITAVGVDSEGKEIPNPKFKIEEFLYTRLHPLLHYVFFAENSHIIPDRYTFLDNTETKYFEVEKLYRLETLPIYWHILNIVGRRMTKYPKAKLKIVGCNCNLDVEKGRKDLSLKRAEAVRDYFLNVWKINKSRLSIEARNLPKKKSTPVTEPDKIVENRRVELYSDVYEILEPVLTTDTLRTCEPPIARFKPIVEAEAGIKKWLVKAILDRNITKEYSSKEYASADNVPDKIDWNINEDRENIWKLKDTIDYFLSVEDMRKQDLRTEEKYMPIEQITLRKKMLNRVKDKIIDKYNLILFDFDKSYIGYHNKKISDFIKSRIKPASEIKITGYTDRTGDFDHNMELSQNRAESTMKSIGRDDATFKGVGETQLLYDNELPEGRFYCRTVEIVAETPIENE